MRELRSVIELAIILCDGETIKREHLQLRAKTKVFKILEDEMTLRDYTKKIIRHYLSKYNNDVTLVARKLEIGRSTIYKMLKEDSLK